MGPICLSNDSQILTAGTGQLTNFGSGVVPGIIPNPIKTIHLVRADPSDPHRYFIVDNEGVLWHSYAVGLNLAMSEIVCSLNLKSRQIVDFVCCPNGRELVVLERSLLLRVGLSTAFCPVKIGVACNRTRGATALCVDRWVLYGELLLYLASARADTKHFSVAARYLPARLWFCQ